jgi:competence protein ComEC
MSELKICFLDVGHGDCSYIELPNGAKMMIDCGCGKYNWPSKLLKYSKKNGITGLTSIPNQSYKYGLDNLVITHPHCDHIGDIEAIHDEIGFFSLTGNYSSIIDSITYDKIDFRKRDQYAVEKFVEIVKK